MIKILFLIAMIQSGDADLPDIHTPPVQQSGWSTYYDLSDASMNGDIMANGKEFDPSAMSIAHRSIPLGTMVLIEHAHTGNRVWAEVTDRGPYGAIHDGRWVLKLNRSDPGRWRGVADLSYGVAKALTNAEGRPPNSDIKIRYWKQASLRRPIVFLETRRYVSVY